MATMQDSCVTLDHNGAEELTLTGQAILVRGMETLVVMLPDLPDDERVQRLNALPLRNRAERGSAYFRFSRSARSCCRPAACLFFLRFSRSIKLTVTSSISTVTRDA